MPQKDNRARNWRKYNEVLVNRGSFTFWFDEESIKQWEGMKGKRGRPQKFSDTAIVCGLTLKAVFNLSFRATEGFIKSIIRSLRLAIEVPDYTLLCKRQKHLVVELPKQKIKPGERITILVDTTGLKVFGEGEWKVRQHGYVKHRLWRKLHLAINSETQEIEAFELTDLGVQDCEGFTNLISSIEKPLGSSIGDGAYDSFSCYEIAEQKDFKLIVPPRRNSKTSQERCRNKKKKGVRKRDEVVQEMRDVGRAQWKVAMGYHRRSLAETAVFRIKTLLGNRLRTRTLEHQKTETAIWCRAINKMTALNRSKTEFLI